MTNDKRNASSKVLASGEATGGEDSENEDEDGQEVPGSYRKQVRHEIRGQVNRH